MAREIHLYSTKSISLSYEIHDVRFEPYVWRKIIIRGLDTPDKHMITPQGALTILHEGEFDILRENIAFRGALKNGSFKFFGPYPAPPSADVNKKADETVGKKPAERKSKKK